jgi:hypothetical protein
MNPPPDRRRMKGVGRVAFIAHLAEITEELDAGWPIKAVYENLEERLGMSYAQFTRYVDQIVRRGRRTQVPPCPAPVPSRPPPVQPLPERLPAIIASEGTKHAGHHAARTFSHDPLEGPDDRKRLLGED